MSASGSGAPPTRALPATRGRIRPLENVNPAESVAAQLLANIRARKFTAIARQFADDADFQAWTPSGHWTATDGRTAARIIEVWFTPGLGSVIQHSYAAHAGRGMAVLECEIGWKLPSVTNSKMKGVVIEGEPRVLRQVYLLAIKDGKITAARVYCAGLHTTFPEVDIEKRRRTKGIAQRLPAASAGNGRAAILPSQTSP